VRHNIKPLGYIRYGDDFVLFLSDRQKADMAKLTSTDWLSDELKLTVHAKNNVIIKANQGLYFLGHKIYPHSPLSINKVMAKKITDNVSRNNMASYKAMHLTKKQSKKLPWLLISQ
jgi:hypothetical protein